MVNRDPRYVETKRLLNDIDGTRPVKLYKVTRAGATTGLSANAIDAKQRFVLLAPTKEIAHMRHVSPATVNKHREHIRRKLRITNKDVNLGTYLEKFMSEQAKKKYGARKEPVTQAIVSARL